jgi:hypothetical protein
VVEAIEVQFMDWLSFSLGFLAFPVVVAGLMGLYVGLTRALGRDVNLSKLAVSQRSSTLDFSPRLIGEIGDAEGDEVADALPGSEPAAKAS